MACASADNERGLSVQNAGPELAVIFICLESNLHPFAVPMADSDLAPRYF